MCNINSLNYLDSSDFFADRVVEIINGGATALMISIGHRTGLLDALAELPPSTSDEIAEHAQLSERYVREWLGAMACAKIVRVDASGQRYWLERAYRPFLSSRGGAENMAPFAQYVAVLAGVESEIVACFQHGGGVSYDRFKRFHEVMAEDSGQTVLSCLFESVLPLVRGIEAELDAGIDVLDIGCGRGKALIMMAQRYPRSRFRGYDLCAEPLQEAAAEAQALGLSNLHFAKCDATTLRDSEAFALITTFDAIHDQARPDIVLQNIFRALKPGGHYLMQDIDSGSKIADNLEHPLGPLLYTLSTMHCMTVSLSQGGMGLGTMWGRDRARKLLAQSGFGEAAEHTLPHDPQNRYFVMRKPE